jgi:hypothetical protein
MLFLRKIRGNLCLQSKFYLHNPVHQVTVSRSLKIYMYKTHDVPVQGFIICSPLMCLVQPVDLLSTAVSSF